MILRLVFYITTILEDKKQFLEVRLFFQFLYDKVFRDTMDSTSKSKCYLYFL